MKYKRTESRNWIPQVLDQPKVVLDREVRNEVVKLLTIVLADEAVLKAKTHNARWVVSGEGSIEMLTLFAVQYKQLRDISIRILNCIRLFDGNLSVDRFENLLQNARLDKHHGDTSTMVELLLNHEAVILFLREDARKCSEEYADVFTHNFLFDILSLHEKMAWMLRASIEPELTNDEYVGGKI
jgi:starvation-inducible DNA-binding protein